MADAIKIRVRNLLGVKKADVVLNTIVLVAGLNGSGKTSLLDAVASAALADATMRGMKAKKDAAGLVHAGQEYGNVTIEYGTSLTRITYPQAAVERQGKEVPFGTALAIGAERFMSLKEDARAREITERFDTRPTRDDLAAFFRDEKHREAGITAEEVDGLWERIENSGWDAVHKGAAEHMTKRKGAWEQVAGQKYGSARANGWVPPGLMLHDDTTVEEAQDRLDTLAAALEELVKKQAADGAVIERVRADAGAVEEKRKAVDELDEAIAALQRQHASKVKERDKAKPDEGTPNQPCPHCGQPVWLKPTDCGISLDKGRLPPEKKELEKSRRLYAVLCGETDNLQFQITEKSRARATAALALQRAEEAEAELVRLLALPGVDAAELQEAQNAKLAAEEKVSLIKRKLEAGRIARDIARTSHMVAALAPDGVRAKKLADKIDAINADLKDLCDVAAFKPVSLSVEMAATYDGRPYVLLSKSEQWRVNFVIACLLNARERAMLMLVDELDILHPQARPGVLKLLKHIAVPALIGMTGRDLDAAPDLAKAGIGVRLWIENGELKA